MNAIKLRYFVHRIDSGEALPLLLSCFAHSGIFHLGFNMSALWCFGKHVVPVFEGPCKREQFWAAYISADTFAPFGDICISLLRRNVLGIPMRPSLGASGAICAVFASFSLLYPDALVTLNVPWDIPAIRAYDFLPLMVAFDLFCLFFRMSFLGHASHLSGVFADFVAIEKGGLQMIGAYQDKVVEIYRKTASWMGKGDD